MVVITWCTLKQNKEQLDEIKRQWKESTRHYLLVSIKNTLIAKMLMEGLSRKTVGIMHIALIF